jgi:hypothetical protein
MTTVLFDVDAAIYPPVSAKTSAMVCGLGAKAGGPGTAGVPPAFFSYESRRF